MVITHEQAGVILLDAYHDSNEAHATSSAGGLLVICVRVEASSCNSKSDTWHRAEGTGEDGKTTMTTRRGGEEAKGNRRNSSWRRGGEGRGEGEANVGTRRGE